MAVHVFKDGDTIPDSLPSAYSCMLADFGGLPDVIGSDAATAQERRHEIAEHAAGIVRSSLRAPGEVWAEELTDQVNVWITRNGRNRRVATYMA